MDLHVFNPEHDIALAYNRRHLTMPHAAQELRMNLGWLPALWAADGDAVLVDDLSFAVKSYMRFKRKTDVLFVTWADLKRLSLSHVQPWGWDLTLRTSLMEAGVSADILPSERQLADIRRLSSRNETVRALECLRDGIKEHTCGESRYLTTMDQVRQTLAEWRKVVLKAPWSSSGRGIRYVEDNMNESTTGWAVRIMQIQGGLMAEPYYNKVKDFGMEFYAHADGSITYEGLSLFQTENNAYTGNILAQEEDKMRMLDAFVPRRLIELLKERVCTYFSSSMSCQYTGPFGLDMMVVARHDRNGFLLHPCVEINVRRTMGHVALSLTPPPDRPPQLMRIIHDVNYGLRLSQMKPLP